MRKIELKLVDNINSIFIDDVKLIGYSGSNVMELRNYHEIEVVKELCSIFSLQIDIINNDSNWNITDEEKTEMLRLIEDKLKEQGF